MRMRYITWPSGEVQEFRGLTFEQAAEAIRRGKKPPPADQHPDGPTESGAFWWAGRMVVLSGRRSELCEKLWGAGNPPSPLSEWDVIEGVYGEPEPGEEEDKKAVRKLKNLVHETREAFRKKGLAVTIKYENHQLWLQPLSD